MSSQMFLTFLCRYTIFEEVSKIMSFNEKEEKRIKSAILASQVPATNGLIQKRI